MSSALRFIYVCVYIYIYIYIYIDSMLAITCAESFIFQFAIQKVIDKDI